MAQPVYIRVESHRVFDDGTEKLAGVQFLLPSGQAVCEKDRRLGIETDVGKVRLAADVLRRSPPTLASPSRAPSSS